MLLSRAPRAVIFDLDGVLLDTEPLYTEATQVVVGRYGKRFGWDLKARVMGSDALDGAKLVIAELELPLTPEAYLEARGSILTGLFRDAPPVAGAEQVVGSLVERRIPMAIGTSSVRALCDLKCERHLWLRAASVVVCGDDPEVVRRKPAPDIFVCAARRLGVPNDDCLVFEDSPAGLRAARSAGMQVVALRTPELDPSLLQEADLVVDSLAELRLSDLGF